MIKLDRRFEHITSNNPSNHGGGPFQKPGAKYYEPTEQDFRNNRVYQAPGCSKVNQAFRDKYDSVFGEKDIFANLGGEK